MMNFIRFYPILLVLGWFFLSAVSFAEALNGL